MSYEWGVVIFMVGLVVFVAGYDFAASYYAAPFVPTSPERVKVMLELAELKPGMKVYDLGSGDGRFLIGAAGLGAEAVGVEIDPFVLLLSRIRIFFSPHRDRIRVRWGSLWKASFHDADVIFVFLMPWNMTKFQRMLEGQLKPGALVISGVFEFPEWDPYKRLDGLKVYAYRFPPFGRMPG